MPAQLQFPSQKLLGSPHNCCPRPCLTNSAFSPMFVQFVCILFSINNSRPHRDRCRNGAQTTVCTFRPYDCSIYTIYIINKQNDRQSLPLQYTTLSPVQLQCEICICPGITQLLPTGPNCDNWPRAIQTVVIALEFHNCSPPADLPKRDLISDLKWSAQTC